MHDDITMELSVTDLEPEVGALAMRLLAWLERGELPSEATSAPHR